MGRPAAVGGTDSLVLRCLPQPPEYGLTAGVPTLSAAAPIGDFCFREIFFSIFGAEPKPSMSAYAEAHPGLFREILATRPPDCLRCLGSTP